jgi:protein-tyrosine phosphatase
MIDLHNHILPGLDDGADDWQQSIAMARMAREDGITGIVCTPHWVPGKYENTRADIIARTAELKNHLDENKIELKIYPGAELRLDISLPEKIASGELITINDNRTYALIELPEESIPDNLEDFLWHLALKNIKPILSHVERQPLLHGNPERLFKLVEMGILTQITAASLLEQFTPKIRDFSLMLLEHRLVHMLVTDSHGLHVRSPKLFAGYEVVKNIIGEEAARKMVYDLPKDIIDGKEVFADDPVPFKKKKWFDFSLPSFLKGN